MHANQLKGEPGCPLVDPSTHCEYLLARTGQHCTSRPRSEPRSVTEAAPGVQRERCENGQEKKWKDKLG